MARRGWSDKNAALVLGIASPSKMSQALTPALVKIAKLWRADPTLTMQAILEAVERLDDLAPMSPDELDLRQRIQLGRVNSAELRSRNGRRR